MHTLVDIISLFLFFSELYIK